MSAARALAALSEPTRFRIVEVLRGGPRPVGDIARRLRLRQPQASKHLRVLSEAGVVERRAVAQQRLYGLREDAFRDLDSWLRTFERIWCERMEGLERTLEEERPRKRKAGRSK